MNDVDRLAVLAHELRSPLAALVAIEHALRDGDLVDGDRRRLLVLGAAAGRDIERLLADPELFSVELRPVEVAELLDGLQGADVEVVAEAGLVVAGDPVRLRQALRNLIANGLRHGDRVVVRAAARGTEVRITIADDGPGVPPELDAFARGVSGVGSTGLGLYVARAVAEAHGGSLELESAPSAGATFTLALPRVDAASG